MHRLDIKSALTVDDAGTITGLAWPFGTPDRVGDVIEKGAFVSLPSRLPMLSEHDPKRTVGVWNAIAETARGLEVKGQLLIGDVQLARDVYAYVKAGAVTGLSIGFQTQKSMPRGARGRTIQRLALHEISLVAVPCHPGARITSAKSALVTSTIASMLNRATQTYRTH